MTNFTLTNTPGAAYIGTEEDDTFIVPSYDAWVAAGRSIDGRGGVDTVDFRFSPASLAQAVNDAEFALVSNLEAIVWSTPGGFILSFNLAGLASASFANGLRFSGMSNLFGAGLTIPVTGELAGSTGSGNDTITVGGLIAAAVSSGGGDDRVTQNTSVNSPFGGNGGFTAFSGTMNGGPGYDILIGLGRVNRGNDWVTATNASVVTGFEEIWADKRFDLLASTPISFTGLDSDGARNPVVIRPMPNTLQPLNLLASDDGRPSYDGRILAFGGAAADTVRGSSTGDSIEGGGGADSLSGEGGNDWLVFQGSAQLVDAAGISGGDGYDVLALQQTAQTVTDAAFARATGMEELRFLGAGAQSVTLGANSDAAFAASSFGAGSVSAGNASSLAVNAAGTSRALSLYGTNGADTLIGGEGADYIASRSNLDVIRAGGGNDHVYFVNAGDFFLPGLNLVPVEVDGGAGYDVLLLDGGFPANFTNFFSVNPGFTSPPVNGPVRNIEEVRLLGTGALSVSMTLQQIFAGSEAGYATIQAPNAGSLSVNLTGFTIGASVYGTAGADSFTAGRGNDYMVGRGGADTFNFAPGCGVDVIADFTSGTDRIALSGFSGVTDFAAVQARSAVVSGNLQISFTPTEGIILAGVTQVAAGDFLFS